jgi:hypothetical protein
VPPQGLDRIGRGRTAEGERRAIDPEVDVVGEATAAEFRAAAEHEVEAVEVPRCRDDLHPTVAIVDGARGEVGEACDHRIDLDPFASDDPDPQHGADVTAPPAGGAQSRQKR